MIKSKIRLFAVSVSRFEFSANLQLKLQSPAKVICVFDEVTMQGDDGAVATVDLPSGDFISAYQTNTHMCLIVLITQTEDSVFHHVMIRMSYSHVCLHFQTCGTLTPCSWTCLCRVPAGGTRPAPTGTTRFSCSCAATSRVRTATRSWAAGSPPSAGNPAAAADPQLPAASSSHHHPASVMEQTHRVHLE